MFLVQVTTEQDGRWDKHYYWLETEVKAKRFARRVQQLRTVVQAWIADRLTGE